MLKLMIKMCTMKLLIIVRIILERNNKYCIVMIYLRNSDRSIALKFLTKEEKNQFIQIIVDFLYRF